MIGWLMAIWRRFFGGYDSKFDFLEHRGVQMITCVLLVFLWEYFAKGFIWYKAIAISIFVYIFWCRGHFYYFQCGTESDKYIDEQLAKGRKPAMNWIVSRINKVLGFKERSRQYCFVGLIIRYTFWALPICILIGWQFLPCAFAIPFVYNAMFWVQLPNYWMMKSPTNWAEFFSGLIIGWGLL